VAFIAQFASHSLSGFPRDLWGLPRIGVQSQPQGQPQVTPHWEFIPKNQIPVLCAVGLGLPWLWPARLQGRMICDDSSVLFKLPLRTGQSCQTHGLLRVEWKRAGSASKDTAQQGLFFQLEVSYTWLWHISNDKGNKVPKNKWSHV
jgi:hypothetical protein